MECFWRDNDKYISDTVRFNDVTFGDSKLYSI